MYCILNNEDQSKTSHWSKNKKIFGVKIGVKIFQKKHYKIKFNGKELFRKTKNVFMKI